MALHMITIIGSPCHIPRVPTSDCLSVHQFLITITHCYHPWTIIYTFSHEFRICTDLNMMRVRNPNSL